ncbi:pleckstrin homology-like domain family A member 1 isoform X2 [Pangasianodon hypophthalmus]|uniref:pleckstrin homology-like domain family A member 1 isoform X2 n=1 Tax=Pangasianodon hypophthalmus TaxID=310915 RepID=UPI0023080C57|nr:pleckstrin homology-like domain family A member 1 isoform X2 [Pangasianodon hypophthalmus]
MQQQQQQGPRALKEGVLEKRSDGLLQMWKRKHCTLTEEAVLLHAPKHAHQHAQAQPQAQPAGKGKELHFSRVKTVDCVERKGKHGYFTVVMADGKEIDFRCRADEGWSAEITLQMVQYKNRQAVLAVRSTRHKHQRLVISKPETEVTVPAGESRAHSANTLTARLPSNVSQTSTCAVLRDNQRYSFHLLNGFINSSHRQTDG